MEDQLQDLLTNSTKILITSHISPDPDAICSALLLFNTLKLNYSGKELVICLEERPNTRLDFLHGFRRIKFAPLLGAIDDFQPELLIIVDANKLGRCSRNDSAQIWQRIKNGPLKIVIIDHHEADDKDPSDIYINNGHPAATQEVFDICFNKWALAKPLGYEETTMLGIVSDTLRFKYDNPKYRETFKIVGELLDRGVSIERLDNKLSRYNKNQLEVMAHLMKNITSGKSGYAYSFMTDDFFRQWQTSHKPAEDLKIGCEIFVNQFIRNFEDRKWGFVIYQEKAGQEGIYAVSFRSESSSIDVAKIARALGGGGHKPAAGVKLKAQSVTEAINKVIKTIEQTH